MVRLISDFMLCVFYHSLKKAAEKIGMGVPIMAQWLTNPTRNHEVTGSISGLAQWVRDPALLWLWCRPAAAALI